MKKIKLLLAAFAAMVTMGVNAQSWMASEVGAGDFYLYNVGKGQFLTRGNGWGTQASTGFNALTLTVEEYDGAYKLRTNINGSGKGLERLGDPVIYTDQSNGKNSTWTFTKVDDASNGPVYTIVSKDNHGGGAGSYMTASADNTIVGPADAVTDDYGRWQLVQAWVTNSMPVADANGWTTSQTPTFDNGNICAEYWNKSAASIKQTLSNLPAGSYELIAVAFTRTGMTATLNAGSNTMSIATASTDEANNRTQANTWFNNGNGVNRLEFTHAGGNLEIGLTADNANGDHWLVWRSFVLLYKGLDLSELKAALQAQIDAVPALQGTTTTAAYNAAKNYADGIDMDALTTEEAISTASSELSNRVNAAKALQTSYLRYNTIKTAALEIAASLDTTTPDAAFDAATTNDAIDAAIASLRATFLAELPNLTIPTDPGYIDVTAVMVDNAGVRTNTDFWTAVENGSARTSGSWAVCNYNECEFYNNNFKFYQTLALTSGTWEFGVAGFHRAGNHSTYFYAGEDKILIPGVESSVVNTMAAAQTYFDNGNGKVTLKFLVEVPGNIEIGIDNQDTQTDKWTIFRDFTLKYYGVPDYSVYEEQWSDAVDAANSALTTYEEYDKFTVSEQETLDAAKNDVPTSEGLKAGYLAKIKTLTDATSAYVAASQKYESAKAAIEKANAVKEAQDFASADAITTFSNAIKAISDKYEDGSLTQEEASSAGVTLGTAITGVRANPDGAAVNYLEDGFGLVSYEEGEGLKINTWSIEGESDGTNFTVPFYEYWTTDDKNLGEALYTGTLTDLPNGLYKISVWVRVRAKNEVAATDATGITMDVNGGDAVDVTEGDQVSQFNIKTYEAQGLVKNGTLELNFNIADGNNISWISFKNIKYTKVRNLLPEEEAVAPTAIALYNGETEVTKPIALNAETTTVALNPVYTPAEATEGYINWTSSDESVATVSSLGVVTAVLPGTATITATSILDANVSASATVTVTFPESELPANSFVNEGATRKVLTLGENLIKNGSFEYPNAYYGWTYGTGSTTPITSEKFNIVAEGAANGDQYLQATVNEGGAAAGSLNTSWAIEPGKTYVFGYKVKSNSASTGNQYIGTSLNTTKGQENTEAKLANPAYGTDWTDVVYTFESGDNTWLVFNARWLANNVSFDNFYLCEASYTLEGNVDYATAAIPSANIGEGAFQYSQDAIDAANDLVQGVATVEEVQAAYDALITINEPAEGQLFNVILTYGGWTYDQKAMTYIANGRTDGGNYNIQYKEAANTNLAQAFTFTKVSDNNYKMSQIDADGNVRYICTGVPYSGNTSQIRTTTNVDDALVVTVIPTATEGVWNLKNTAANQYIGSQDAGVYTVNSHIDFNIVETTKPSITINTTAAGWGTVILPFAQALPEGVNAYSVDELDGDKLTLNIVDGDLEANKPYIIEGAWEEIVTGDAQGTALNYKEGLLTGVYESQEATEGTYILQKQGELVGFFLVDYTDWAYATKPQVNANRAYLTAPTAGVKAFYLGDMETAIQSVFDGVANGDIYDLNGRKVQKLQKGGVYIVNGKKVSVK